MILAVLAVRILVPTLSLVSLFHIRVRLFWCCTTQVSRASSPSTFTRGVVKLWLREGAENETDHDFSG